MQHPGPPCTAHFLSLQGSLRFTGQDAQLPSLVSALHSPAAVSTSSISASDVGTPRHQPSLPRLVSAPGIPRAPARRAKSTRSARVWLGAHVPVPAGASHSHKLAALVLDHRSFPPPPQPVMRVTRHGPVCGAASTRPADTHMKRLPRSGYRRLPAKSRRPGGRPQGPCITAGNALANVAAGVARRSRTRCSQPATDRSSCVPLRSVPAAADSDMSQSSDERRAMGDGRRATSTKHRTPVASRANPPPVVPHSRWLRAFWPAQSVFC